MNIKPFISIVSPEYKGARMIPELVSRITASVSEITDNFEIILVNDGSPDDTWAEILKAGSADRRVKGLNLSRNFGQHYAITAGLSKCSGEWIVVMDCDLQDRPEEIPNLYKKALEGYDIVYARRINKQFGFLKKLSSSLYHKVFDWLSGQHTDPAIGNFGIYSAQVIDEFNKMPEVARDFNTLMSTLGFKIGSIDITHAQRAEGKSSYTFGKLLHLSANTILANSNKPLKIATMIGFLMAFVSTLIALYNILARITGIISVPGYTTTVFSIWFVGGIILFMLGVSGLYIGRIFDQVKSRQLFIIRDTVNI